MYLHLGQDTILRTKEILGIFDLDTPTLSKHAEFSGPRGKGRARGECDGRAAQKLHCHAGAGFGRIYHADICGHIEKKKRRAPSAY